MKENETTVVGGMIERDQTLSLRGTPDHPQLAVAGIRPGSVATKRTTDSGETELLLIITPRRLRLA